MPRIAAALLLCACATAKPLPSVEQCQTTNDACVSRCFSIPGLIPGNAKPPCPEGPRSDFAPPCSSTAEPNDTLAIARCSNACDEAAKVCRALLPVPEPPVTLPPKPEAPKPEVEAPDAGAPD